MDIFRRKIQAVSQTCFATVSGMRHMRLKPHPRQNHQKKGPFTKQNHPNASDISGVEVNPKCEGHFQNQCKSVQKQ
jgi:hypothetical protein